MFLNIVCLDQIQKSLILQEKTAKFELSHQKKVLDECSSTLGFFLVKYVHISIFSANVIFSILMKNMFKKSKFKKELKIYFF